MSPSLEPLSGSLKLTIDLSVLLIKLNLSTDKVSPSLFCV